MTWVCPRESRGRGGRRGPSEDEGGAGVCRVGDEKEGNEGFHPQSRDKPEPLCFRFVVGRERSSVSGLFTFVWWPLNNNHQYLWLKNCLRLVATALRVPVRTPPSSPSMACPITSTTTTTAADPNETTHGLVYPPNFLSSLQVLLPRPPPHQPIRGLSAKQFAQIHLQSLLSHAPDSVLFPFLHGLEGDNEAQIQFFSSYGRVSRRSILPNYRGLIWVACDDDHPEVPQSTHSSPVYSDDDDLDDDDFSSSEIECDDQPFEMDIDHPPSSKLEIDTNDLQHMHPVHHRTMSTASDSQPPVYAVDYAYSGTHHDRRPSSASSFAASSLDSPDSATTDPGAPQLVRDDPGLGTGASPPVPLSPSPPPPMSWTLTSSFRPSELLVNTQSGPEFVRPRVPDGISLRNFGIQVVSSISDQDPAHLACLLRPVIVPVPADSRDANLISPPEISPSMPQHPTSSSTLQRGPPDLLSLLLKSLSGRSRPRCSRGRTDFVRTAIRIRKPT